MKRNMSFNPFSANPTKLSTPLKQFVGIVDKLFGV